jgi:hypothetical protein
MFFEDHEKAIYSPHVEGFTERQYDPLVVLRCLALETGNKLSTLVDTWNAPCNEDGDVSVEGRARVEEAFHFAQQKLAHVSRKAFDLPEFPEATEGQVLEVLFDFLDYLEKKGQRPVSGPLSPTTSPAPRPEFVPTTSSSPLPCGCSGPK